jgi:hypothetical protein
MIPTTADTTRRLLRITPPFNPSLCSCTMPLLDRVTFLLSFKYDIEQHQLRVLRSRMTEWQNLRLLCSHNYCNRSVIKIHKPPSQTCSCSPPFIRRFIHRKTYFNKTPPAPHSFMCMLARFWKVCCSLLAATIEEKIVVGGHDRLDRFEAYD